MKFCTNQRVRVSDKEKLLLLLLRTELGTNLEPQFGLAAQTRSSEKLLLDFGFLLVSFDQRQSRSSEPTIRDRAVEIPKARCDEAQLNISVATTFLMTPISSTPSSDRTKRGVGGRCGVVGTLASQFVNLELN